MNNRCFICDNIQPFYGSLDFVRDYPTWVCQYEKKHSPTYTYPDRQSSFICFLHLLQSMASSRYSLHARQSFCTTSDQVFLGLPLGLASSSSYSMHFFTQSLSYFHSTFPCHCNLFCCSTEIISSNPSLSLTCTWNSILYLNATHPSDHSRLCPVKCHLIFFSYIYNACIKRGCHTLGITLCGFNATYGETG